MKKKIIRTLSLIIALTLVLSTGDIRTFAQKKPKLKTESALIYCKTTDEKIYAKAVEKKQDIGDMTKLMSCYIAVHKLGMDKVVEVKEGALLVEKQVATVSPGESFTVRDLVYQGLLQKANDSIMALVLEISKNEKAFVKLMNKQARAWGLSGTFFNNSTGQINKSHKTTAIDLVEMYSSILENCPEIKEVLTEPKYTLVQTETRESKIIENDNYFLLGGEVDKPNKKEEVEPVEIVSNGFISTYKGNKSSMIVGVDVNGLECYVTTLNTKSTYQYVDGKKLLNYAKENVSSYKVFDKKLTFEGGFVKYGAKNKVVAVAEKEGYINLPEGASASLVTTKVKFKKKLIAPIEKGQKVGKVDIFLADEWVSSVNINAKEEIPRGWFLSGIGISNMQTIIIFTVSFILLFIFFSILYLKAKRKREREKRRKAKLREIARRELERENDHKRRDWPYK